MKTWFVLPILALTVLGCSNSLMARRDDGAATTEELKKRVLELQRQATVHELEIERLQARLTELEKRRVASPESRPPSASSAPARRRDIPVETIEPPSLEESDLEAVSLGKPAPPPPPPLPNRTSGPPPVVEAPAASTSQVSPVEQEAYDRGYTLYHQGRYLDAEGELRRFQQQYPDSSLADNAQYWIGESRYARKDVEGALAAFRETVERFPDGNKVPDALLKAGQCFEALEDRNAAIATYREVIERYPTSAAAARAEGRLSSLE